MYSPSNYVDFSKNVVFFPESYVTVQESVLLKKVYLTGFMYRYIISICSPERFTRIRAVCFVKLAKEHLI